MKKEVRILTIKNSPQFINWLLKFRYDDLIVCPRSRHFDYRTKKDYTSQEQKILKVLYKVNGAVEMFCPTVCSGNRGDGSSFRYKCKFFGGYGMNKEKVWNFRNPQKFILCSKAKNEKIYPQKITHDCKRRKLATTVARQLELIYIFGSACLEHTPIEECLKCKYKTEKGCNFKISCKKGEGFIFIDCVNGICEGCSERKKQ